MFDTEPRPTELVCPECGALVRHGEPKKPESPWGCPNGHEAARFPITYQRWLAEAALMNGAIGDSDG